MHVLVESPESPNGGTNAYTFSNLWYFHASCKNMEIAGMERTLLVDVRHCFRMIAESVHSKLGALKGWPLGRVKAPGMSRCCLHWADICRGGTAMDCP